MTASSFWSALGGRRVLRATLRLSGNDRLTAARVLGLLVLAELGLRSLPLPTLSRWFGVPLSTAPAVPQREDGSPRLTASEGRQVGLARRVAAHWPFGRGPCLRLSLVEGHFLRRRAPVLRVGVASADGKGEGPAIIAHAWVEIDGWPLDDQAGFLPFETTRS
jgi:hypothetical protein